MRGATPAAIAAGLACLLAGSPSLARSPWAALAASARAAGDARPARVFKVTGPVAETDDPWDVFGLDGRVVFGELLDALDAAARDPAAGPLVLKLRSGDLGLSRARELSRAVERARRAGKRVVAHLETADAASLVAAAAADDVVMTPEGVLLVPGVRAEVTFYKDLLATVGVEADVESVGRYKSAAEPLTRSTMSPEAREALEAVMDGLWDTLVDDLARLRHLDRKRVLAALDQGLLGAEEARRLGLVDRLATWEDVLAGLSEGERPAPVLAYPAAPELPELGSLFGLLELLTRRPAGGGEGDARVAVVVVEGTIVGGRAPDDPWGEAVAASDDLVDSLRALEEDPRVKAVVLRVDSPGGSALASDVIWQAVSRVDKERPVVASLGNVAASGGYYVATAARRIVAEPTTLTGSIGVLGGKLVLAGLHDKLGLSTVVLSRGRHAGMFSSLRRFSDSEREVFQRSMKRTYDTFVNRVARGRRMSWDAVDRVAQGRVWCGRDARGRGLVDDLGGLHEAVEAAARLAGLDPAAVEVVRYPEPRSLLELLQQDTRTLTAPRVRVDLAGALLPATALGEGARAAWLLATLLEREPVLAMLPYAVSIR